METHAVAPAAPWWRTDAELACPAPRADLHVQVVGDEALFTDLRSQTTYRLNGTALTFWERLDPARTTREVARDVARQYGADPEQVLDDLEQTLAFFAAHGLLAP